MLGVSLTIEGSINLAAKLQMTALQQPILLRDRLELQRIASRP
jgi:hypothetical protein